MDKTVWKFHVTVKDKNGFISFHYKIYTFNEPVSQTTGYQCVLAQFGKLDITVIKCL